MPLRTFQIAHRRGGALNTPAVLFTCPAGSTLLVKDIRVAVSTSSALRVVISVRKAGLQAGIFDQQVGPAGATGQQLQVVLEPADELIWVVPAAGGTDVSGVACVISGALLEGVVPVA